jgi:hypothetical protein
MSVRVPDQQTNKIKKRRNCFEQHNNYTVFKEDLHYEVNYLSIMSYSYSDVNYKLARISKERDCGNALAIGRYGLMSELF